MNCYQRGIWRAQAKSLLEWQYCQDVLQSRSGGTSWTLLGLGHILGPLDERLR